MVATPPGDYGSAHLLITAHGSLPGGEVWSCGLRTIAASPPQSELQQYADYTSAIWKEFWNYAAGLHVFNPAGVKLLGTTVRSLNVAGVTTGLAESPVSASVGNAGSSPGPNQIALAVTLMTATAGRHGKGRVYLPFLAGNTDGDTGRIAGATAGVIATSFAQLIRNLETVEEALTLPLGLPPTLWRIAVQSRTSGAAGAPVTSVRVGDVQDTIRRRRNKLGETYVTVAVPAP